MPETVMLTVPKDLLIEAGISENRILEMFTVDNSLIIRNADLSDDFICGKDCDHCPMERKVK